MRTLGYDWYFEQGKKGKNSGDHITINSIDMPKNVFEADYFYAITEEGKKGEKLKGANPKVTSLTRGAVPNTTESESNITLSTMGIDPKTGTIGVQGLGIGNVDNEKLDEKKPAFARYINRVKANDLDYGDNVYSLRVDGDPGKFELEKNGLG
ncbi:MAG: hypothetical protein LBE56_12785 [Tannerella sp.]|nr:hypothetical protein [Tannerella sp.]